MSPCQRLWSTKMAADCGSAAGDLFPHERVIHIESLPAGWPAFYLFKCMWALCRFLHSLTCRWQLLVARRQQPLTLCHKEPQECGWRSFVVCPPWAVVSLSQSWLRNFTPESSLVTSPPPLSCSYMYQIMLTAPWTEAATKQRADNCHKV